VLVDQPLPHPPGGVALLARRVQVHEQHRVDERLVAGSSRGATNVRGLRGGGNGDASAWRTVRR
jgi:hypothetical protein